MIGIYNNYNVSSILKNLEVWLSTIILFELYYIYYFYFKILTKEEINKIIFLSFISYSLLKSFLLFLIILSENKLGVYLTINKLFDITWVLGFINGFPRLISTNDILVFLVLSIVLSQRYLNKSSIILIYISAIFILFTYSRMFWLYLLIIIIFLTITRKKIVIHLLLISLAFFTFQHYHIEERLSNHETHISNEIKIQQIELFVRFWINHPSSLIIGQGLGSYLPEYIRNTIYPFSYEVQWFSFLYQFGFLFLVPIITFFLLPLTNSCRKLNIMQISYILFLLAGFTNPYLISGFSGALIFGYLINMYECKK